jgi:hypothetical protein
MPPSPAIVEAVAGEEGCPEGRADGRRRRGVHAFFRCTLHRLRPAMIA